jgi:hypothetical protein
MKKTVIKGCKVHIRTGDYESIEFNSSSECEIEYNEDIERIALEKKCWSDVIADLKTAMGDWAGSIRYGGSAASEKFIDKSSESVGRYNHPQQS